MKLLVLYHSLYGHISTMADAIAEGARQVPGADVAVKRVPETLPEGVLEQMGATQAQQALADVPVADPNELGDYDAIIFGTAARFGNMSGQMRNFLDQTGRLWMEGGLVGKVGSVFVSTSTQHGGQESTILSFHITAAASRDGHLGPALRLPGTDALGRDHGRQPIRRFDDRGAEPA